MINETLQDAPARVVPDPPPAGDLQVVLVRWPADEDERTRLRMRRVPRLLLVDRDAPPPIFWDVDEDWIRLPADPDDVRLRVQMLCRRTGASEPDAIHSHETCEKQLTHIFRGSDQPEGTKCTNDL